MDGLMSEIGDAAMEALTRSFLLGTARHPAPVAAWQGLVTSGSPPSELTALALLGQRLRYRRRVGADRGRAQDRAGGRAGADAPARRLQKWRSVGHRGSGLGRRLPSPPAASASLRPATATDLHKAARRTSRVLRVGLGGARRGRRK